MSSHFKMPGAIALTLSLVVSTAAAQSLTFTTLGSEGTRSGSSGTSLSLLTSEDVATVTPINVGYSAESYAVHMNWNTLVGDGDGDAFYYENPLAKYVDALHPCSKSGDIKIRDLFISGADPIPTASGSTLRPAGVGAIRPGANVVPLISEAMIRSALDITPNLLNLNVDAITVDQKGSIYLSFEDQIMTSTGVVLNDGGIAMIPAWAILWAGCSVATVAPMSGGFILSEATMDAITANAMAADVFGGMIAGVSDVDGLEVDPRGGSIGVVLQGQQIAIPNLIFSGERLTGGAILSTNLGGDIAVINGFLMATPFGFGPTTGSQVGLNPVSPSILGKVGSLNGLALHDLPQRFIMDSTTPYLPSAGTLDVTVGGADPGALVLVLLGLGPVGAGGFQPSVPVMNPCFPEWFSVGFGIGPFAADVNGFLNLPLAYGGGVPAGMTVVFQSVSPKGSALGFSAPITIQF